MSQGPPPIPQSVQVLAYTEPATEHRPGAVTTIGVLSIILGALGCFWSGMVGLVSLGFLIAASAASAITAAGGTTTTGSDYAGPNGFYAPQRDIIVRAFAAKQPMTPAQQAQLAYLLADVGQQIAPAMPTNNTSADPADDYLKQNLTGNSGVNVEGGGGTWVEVPIGKITLTDTTATFTPNPGECSVKPVQRSTVRQMPNPANPSVLSAAEIQTVLDRIQQIAGSTPLNPVQLAVLKTRLQTTPMPFTGAPADMPALVSQINTVVPTGGGLVMVRFTSTTLTLSPTGTAKVISSFSGNAPFPKMRTWPLALVLCSELAGIALSIYLLVAGIVTLRNSLVGGRLHKVYAWIKIGLTVIGAIGSWWAWQDFAAGMASQGSPPSTAVSANWASISTSMTFGIVLLGVAYPITVLLLLRTQAVKTFYSVK